MHKLLTMSLVVFSIPSIVFGFTFERSMYLGATGQDVLELQKVLNKDFDTRVADSGPGSPGQETSYFGLLTKLAVASFQHKYYNEVLSPLGLTTPTGYVGALTLKKLNSMGSANTVSTESDTRGLPNYVSSVVPSTYSQGTNSTQGSISPENIKSAQIYNFFVNKTKPLFFNLSRYEAGRGQAVTINGSGFTKTGNTIHLGNNYKLDNLTSLGGNQINFIVPNTIPNGTYNVWVENQDGSSYDSSYGDFFTISDNPNDPPTIENINPSEITFGENTTVTINGGGFDKESNDLYSTLGVIHGAPSQDGKTITFSLDQLPQLSSIGQTTLSGFAGKVSFPVYVVVKNSFGISSGTSFFLLKF